MVLFWPIQQELDCVSDSGRILGKIKYDGANDDYVFSPADESIALTSAEQSNIDARLSGLRSGEYIIPMQDDD